MQQFTNDDALMLSVLHARDVGPPQVGTAVTFVHFVDASVLHICGPLLDAKFMPAFRAACGDNTIMASAVDGPSQSAAVIVAPGCLDDARFAFDRIAQRHAGVIDRGEMDNRDQWDMKLSATVHVLNGTAAA